MTQCTPKNNMAETKPVDTPEWIHPDQVMQMHRLKMRKRALQARINRQSSGNSTKTSLDITVAGSSSPSITSGSQKRKNPFLKNDPQKKLKDNITAELETTTDSVLFELIKLKSSESTKTTVPSKKSNLSFSSVLAQLEINDKALPKELETPKGESYIPIDWTLCTKMRLMSPKPFPWNGKLKTSEQASGTTGFVRCIDTGTQETTLDTSPNARYGYLLI